MNIEIHVALLGKHLLVKLHESGQRTGKNLLPHGHSFARSVPVIVPELHLQLPAFDEPFGVVRNPHLPDESLQLDEEDLPHALRNHLLPRFLAFLDVEPVDVRSPVRVVVDHDQEPYSEIFHNVDFFVLRNAVNNFCICKGYF